MNSDYKNNDIDPLLSSSVENEESDSIETSEQTPQSNWGSFYLTLKSFLGTGILFLPRAYSHAGYLASSALMFLVAILTTIAIERLLLVARERDIWNYAKIGKSVGGVWLARCIKIFLFLSQMGFCCAYLIFVAENTVSVLNSFDIHFNIDYVLLIQLAIYAPLSLIKKLEFFGRLSIMANALIFVSVFYIIYASSAKISSAGPGPDIQIWSPSFPIFIGTAIFSYEGFFTSLDVSRIPLILVGVGMVLPICRTISQPQKYATTLRVCVIIVTIIYISVGTVAYFAFGSNTDTIILFNLPNNLITITVQFLYSISIMLTFPVMVFPILTIASSLVRGSSLILDRIYRLFAVFFLVVVAYFGKQNLDKFVSLTGAISCIPLTFVFPSLFSLYHGSNNRFLDISLFTLGVVLSIAVTVMNIIS